MGVGLGDGVGGRGVGGGDEDPLIPAAASAPDRLENIRAVPYQVIDEASE